MSSTKGFHPEGHQFAFAPNFAQVALSNDQPIVDALTVVFKARKRNVPEDMKKRMVHTVEQFAGDTRIGALRQLPEEQWSDLKIPLMARVYLKHLMTQSVSLTALELLECDFNNGKVINWGQYDQGLEFVINMGFQKTDALESLIVCRNELQEALNFLLLPDASKKNERDRARRLHNNFVPPTQHHTVLAADRAALAELEKYNHRTGRELKDEIERLKADVEAARARNKSLEQQIEDKRKKHQMNLYREYLRGLLCDNRITPDELQHLEKHKKNRGIDAEAHKQVLTELNYTEEQFDGLKDFQTTQYSNECVICFEPPRDHLVLPCRHCCMCEDCAEDHMDMVEDGSGKCPQCREPIKEIKKVFF